MCLASRLAVCDNIERRLIVDDYDKSINCSPWKYDKYHNSSCNCGADIYNIVECSESQSTVRVFTCNCMTYSDNSNELVVGSCPYLCSNQLYFNIDKGTDFSNIGNQNLNQNRKGQMCGRCKENHSPSPYSYRLKCEDCSNYKHNWIKYILMAYLPSTFFCLMIVIFRFNALSPSLNGFIFCCQIIILLSHSVMGLLGNQWRSQGWARLGLAHPTVPMAHQTLLGYVNLRL